MMLDPISYIEEKRNLKLVKLYEEKNYLEQYITDYKQGKIKNEDCHVSSSTGIISSVYEEYLAELNSLIEQKERENRTEKKYIELTDFRDIDMFLQDNNCLHGTKIHKIFNKNGIAKIIIKDDEQEIEICFYEVDEFTMIYFTDKTYIGSVHIKEIDKKVRLEINDNVIYISAKSMKLKTLDLDNTIYTYVSVKYEENQEKTFYYISNIENLSIGDYVYVPVRNSFCPAIVENIEKFSYNDVPFPINKTKTIIRKSSKIEYENYNNNEEVNIFEKDYEDDYDEFDTFKFKDYSTIIKRAKRLPFIKSRKVEWKKDSNGLSFPSYDKAVFEWIEAFHNLELLDYNYIENFKYIKNGDIEELDFDEILSYLTYIIRGERFCDGLIASNLSNGTIELLEEKLFSYLVEFTEINDKNLEDFNEEDVMFLTLAESGAMGEPNGIEIVTKKENHIKFYHTNISIFDVRKLYSKFSTLKTLNCRSIWRCKRCAKWFCAF